MKAKELSLRPYPGRLFVTRRRKDYKAADKELFRTPDVHFSKTAAGRYSAGEGVDGLWTYLVYAEEPHTLAHELSHVVLHTFGRCGIDPREANGEPFCYLLSQLMLEAAR